MSRPFPRSPPATTPQPKLPGPWSRLSRAFFPLYFHTTPASHVGRITPVGADTMQTCSLQSNPGLEEGEVYSTALTVSAGHCPTASLYNREDEVWTWFLLCSSEASGALNRQEE